MMRTLLSVLLGLLPLPAVGQIIIHGPRPTTAPRPAGIILPPQLPATIPTNKPIVPQIVAPRLIVNPYWYWNGYVPFYPEYERPAPTIINNYIPVPVPLLSPPAPVAPVVKKARLQLNLPPRSQVWINDQRVDSAAVPLLVESPELREGQSYTFAVKVVWSEGDQREERTRTVTVPVGEQKSLTYFATK